MRYRGGGCGIEGGVWYRGRECGIEEECGIGDVV